MMKSARAKNVASDSTPGMGYGSDENNIDQCKCTKCYTYLASLKDAFQRIHKPRKT